MIIIFTRHCGTIEPNQTEIPVQSTTDPCYQIIRENPERLNINSSRIRYSAANRLWEDVIMRPRLITAIFCCSILLSMASTICLARAEDDQFERQTRWIEIEKAVFGDRMAEPDEAIIKLDAPERAEDAALVPIEIKLNADAAITGLYIIVDDNPAPMAGHFTFGPAAYVDDLKLRVRVNSYTNMHAVAELTNGRLVEAVSFVKASGGCSAPVGASEEEAMQGIGDIRMKFAGHFEPGKSARATVMVRHPNFSGMQMDLDTRGYTPARYIQTLKVTEGDELVFTLSGDISMSSNPVIGFSFKTQSSGPLTVSVDDSEKMHWQKSFAPPTVTN
jgi:sulfur-oxidizing protein SoxY